MNLQFNLQSLEDRVVPANFVWDGGGANSLFSNRFNWVGDVAPTGLDPTDDLTFNEDGISDLSPFNDLPSFNAMQMPAQPAVARFDSITISASGYNIGGELITLGSPGMASSGNITVNDAINNTISANLLLSGAGTVGNRQTISVIGSSELIITGRLSSNAAVELVKNGTGELTLSGDNSNFIGPVTLENFGGSTFITNVNALGNTAQGTTIGTGATLGVVSVAGTINERLIINGFGVANEGALLNVSGSNTWAGQIELDSDSTFGSRAGTMRITGLISDRGSGHDVIKEGQANVTFARDNTYRGTTTVNDGILTIQTPFGLGAQGSLGNGTFVNQSLTKNGTLQLSTATGTGFTVRDEFLTLNGSGSGGIGALNNLTGNNQWAAPVFLGRPSPDGLNVTIGVTNPQNNNFTNPNDTLLISGVIGDSQNAAGPPQLNKVQTGKLIFSNANTYQGQTNVLEGILTIRDSQGLSDPASEGTFVEVGATLELDVDSGNDPHGRPLGVDSVTGVANRLEVDEILLINGRGVGATGINTGGLRGGVGALRNLTGINTYVADIILGDNNSDVAIGVEPEPTATQNADTGYFDGDFSLTIEGDMSGDTFRTFVKVGTGHMILPRAYSFESTFDIEQGFVTISDAGALGADLGQPISDTVQPETLVREGAALHIRGGAGGLVLTENILLFGDGIVHNNPLISGRGALMSIEGNNLWRGDIELNGGAGVGSEDVFASAFVDEFTVTGDVTDFGTFKAKHSGGGFSANVVDMGDGVTSGVLIIDFGFGLSPDQLRVHYPPRGTLGSTIIGDTGVVAGGGILQVPFSGTSQFIEIVVDEVNGAGGWNYSAQVVTNVTGGLNKWGRMRLRLQGNNSYTSTTNVNGGVLTLQDDTSLGSASGGTFINNDGAIELESGPAPGAIPNNVNNGGLPTSGVQVFGESLTIFSRGNMSTEGTFIAPLTSVSGDNMWRGPVSFQTDPLNIPVSAETDITIDTRQNTRFIMLGNVSNPVNQAAVGLVKTGTGELVINGVNTYRGETDIRAGIVTIQNGQALGTSNGPNSGTIIANDATLQLQGDITVAGEALTVLGDGINTVPNTPFRWFTTGPAGITNGETPGNDRVSGGRVLHVTTDPTDDKVVYIATATGGAWKTKDGGRTWNPLIDNINGVPADMQTMFISQIVIDPTDTRIIYIATGEGNNELDSFYGNGIYQTLDGGVNWTRFSSPSALAQAANTGLGTPAIPARADVFAGKAINKLVLDPLNSANLFVALGDTGDGNSPIGNNGIWRYTAATDTWENIVSDAFRSNNRTTPNANNMNVNGSNGPDDDINYYFSTFEDYTDVVVGTTGAQFNNPTAMTDPSAFGRVIAFSIGSIDGGTLTSNQTGMTPVRHFMNGVYVSAEFSLNGNFVWKRASFATDETINNVLFPTVGNIKLALSRQVGGVHTLYATASYPENRPGLGVENPFRGNILRNVFRTTVTTVNTPAAGTTPANTVITVANWAATTSPGEFMTNNVPGTLGRGRGDFAQAVAVNPTNPMIVYVASVGQPVGLGLFQSTTGGGGWNNINTGVDGFGPHGYVHAMSFDRLGKLTVATDGGVWYLDNSTFGAIRWVQRNGNLSLTQFQGIATHPTDPNIAVGGSRGNGVEIFTGSQTWRQTDNSEGGRVYIDQQNPNIYYSVVETPGTSLIRKSTNAGQTWTTLFTTSRSRDFDGPPAVVPNAAPLPAEFAPLILDTIDTDRILSGSVNRSITAFTLFESSDGGATFTDLLADRFTVNPIQSIAVAGVQGEFTFDAAFPNATDRGSSIYDPDTIYFTDGVDVFLSKNHGISFVTRSNGLGGAGFIRDLIVDPRDRDTAYVVSSSLGNAQQVFRTTDAGRNWINITADLPAGIPVWKILIDPRFRDPATGETQTVLYIGTESGIYTRTFNDSVIGAPPGGWTRFGENMPNVQVRDLNLNQNTGVLSAGTYGRSMYQFFLPDVIANGGAVRAVSGSSVWTGAVTLVGNTVLGAAGTQFAGSNQARLNFLGPIGDGTGSFDITKIGGGSITFSGANAYDGTTFVEEGVLRSNNRTALGTPGNGTFVANGAALELTADLDLEPITINGDGFELNDHNTGSLRNVANSNTYTGPLTINNAPRAGTPLVIPTQVTIGVDTGSQLTITNIVTDGANDLNIVKELTGTLVLAGANTYDGVTDVRQGALRVANDLALGSSALTDNTIITDGAQLQLSGGVNTPEFFRVSGTGINETGAILNFSESNTISGPVAFARIPSMFPASSPPFVVSVNVVNSTDTLTISGDISEELPPPPPTPILLENFDGVGAPALPVGFTSTSTGLAVNWTTNTAQRTSVPNSAFSGASPDDVSTTTLTSPTVTLLDSASQLTFRNSFNLENTFDGGVLEVSVNGGAFQDIVAAGGVFLSGGYNSTISTLFASPIAGRAAWSGNSGGFQSVTVELSVVASVGDTLQFRWIVATDSSVTTGNGQRIDDIGMPGTGIPRFGLTKIGDGRLTLSGDNQHSGDTLITDGTIRVVGSNTALGTVSGNRTVVSDGAALEYDGSLGSLTIPESVVVSGAGATANPLGGLFNVSGTNTQVGSVLLQTDSAIGTEDDSSLTITSVVSDPTPLLSENFDAPINAPKTLPGEFASTFTNNAVAWTTDNTASTSGMSSAFSGVGSPTADDTSLFSPRFTQDGTNPVLSFRNFFDLQSSGVGVGQDLAYLEISVNGGGFEDIIAAGGVFLSGGYNATADTANGNLFPGREGWSGQSAGFERVVVDLENVARTGDLIQFRWRVVTDNGTQSVGQRIDDIVLSVASGIDKVGTGTLNLTNANTYNAATSVEAGVLNISNALALGDPLGEGTTVQAGATLQLQNNITVTAESLTLNGAGFNGQGALENLSDSNVWMNPITLGSNSTIGVTAGDLTINAPIDDGVNTFGVTKVGTGPLTYGPNAINTYTGTTTVNEGTLFLNATGGNSIAGDLTVGDTLTGTGTVQQLQSNQVADTATVIVQSDGVYDLLGQTEQIGDLTINQGLVTTNSTGTSQATGAILTVNDLTMVGGTATAANNLGGSQIDKILIAGGNLTTTPTATVGPRQVPTINGDGQLSFEGTDTTFLVNDNASTRVDLQIDALLAGFAGDTLTKSGAGRLSYSDFAFYSGGLVLTAGDFEVTGGIQDVTLSGGTLSGTGSTGVITGSNVGGTVNPGLNGTGGSTGILNSNTVNADDSTTFFFELNGTTPGTGHDQLVVTGDLNLAGATLTGSVGSGVALNDRFTIITYTGVRTGQFAEPFGNDRVFINGLKFNVIYDDINKIVVLERVKNDAVLTVTSSLNPSFFSQPVTFTARVVGEPGAAGVALTGTVIFAINGVDQSPAVFIDGTTPATLLVPQFEVGTYVITARYSGNAEFNTANDILDVNQVVNGLRTTTVVQDTPDPSNLGSPVGINILVRPTDIPGSVPTGSVNVQINGGPVINFALVNGMVSLPPTRDLPQGTSTIVATYLPDTVRYQTSTTTTTHITNPPGQNSTMTTLAVTPEPSNIGQPATITATVSNPAGGPPPDGSVTLRINGNAPIVLALNNGVATIQTSAFNRGNNTIIVTYNADDPSGNFSASSRTITHVVNPPTITATTINASVNPSPSQFGGLVTISATVTSAFPGIIPQGTAQVIINGGAPSFVNLVNGQLTLVTSGFVPNNNTIRIVYNGDDPTGSFLASERTINHTVRVTVTTPTVTLNVTPSPAVQGSPVTINSNVVSQVAGLIPTGTATLIVNGTPVQTLGLVNGAVSFTTTLAIVGNNVIRVVYNGDANFSGTSTTVNQLVTRPDGGTAGAFKNAVAFGADGGGSRVVVLDAATGQERISIFAYDPLYTGGVKVALGDINGDGTLDIITGTGSGSDPHVKAFDGRDGRELLSFYAYLRNFTGGVNVASGDVNGDGFADIITGAGPGAGPHVKVFDGRSGQEISSFFAYIPNFLGGVNVAAGDLNGDGRADIITGSAAIATHVKAFDGRTGAEVRSFFAFNELVTGGVFVSAGDVNGDGRADIIASPGSGGPHVRAFSGQDNRELLSFFAFEEAVTANGIRVGTADADRNGISEIIVTQGLGGRARIFNPLNNSLIEQDLPFDTPTIGVFVG